MRTNGNCSYCCDIFQHHFFQNFLSGITSECQTAWRQIRSYVLLDLICVQTICKDHQPASRQQNSLNNSLPTGNLAYFLSSADFFFKISFFENFFQEYHQCQTAWIQIRLNILSARIWVQTVCKCSRQITFSILSGLI